MTILLMGLFMFVNPQALKNASQEIDLPLMKGSE